jgi:hypothetical protein
MNRVGEMLKQSAPLRIVASYLAAVGANFARRRTRLVSDILAVWRTAVYALHRANSAGLGAAELNRYSRRERVRIVKDALARRHEDVNHCC